MEGFWLLVNLTYSIGYLNGIYHDNDAQVTCHKIIRQVNF